MFTFSEMLGLVESENSFGAYVCRLYDKSAKDKSANDTSAKPTVRMPTVRKGQQCEETRVRMSIVRIDLSHNCARDPE